MVVAKNCYCCRCYEWNTQQSTRAQLQRTRYLENQANGQTNNFNECQLLRWRRRTATEQLYYGRTASELTAAQQGAKMKQADYNLSSYDVFGYDRRFS